MRTLKGHVSDGKMRAVQVGRVGGGLELAECVVDFDTKVANGAFDPRVPEKYSSAPSSPCSPPPSASISLRRSNSMRCQQRPMRLERWPRSGSHRATGGHSNLSLTRFRVTR